MTTEIGDSLVMTLFGGRAEPHRRPGEIPWYATTFRVHAPEAVLRVRVAMFGRSTAPSCRLLIVSLDAETLLIHCPEIVLGNSQPSLRRCAVPARR